QGICTKVAGILEAGKNTPETTSALVRNHDPEPCIIPGLRKGNRLRAVACDGHIRDRGIDFTVGRCLHEIPKGRIVDILERQSHPLRDRFPKVDRHSRIGILAALLHEGWANIYPDLEMPWCRGGIILGVRPGGPE